MESGSSNPPVQPYAISNLLLLLPILCRFKMPDKVVKPKHQELRRSSMAAMGRLVRGSMHFGGKDGMVKVDPSTTSPRNSSESRTVDASSGSRAAGKMAAMGRLMRASITGRKSEDRGSGGSEPPPPPPRRHAAGGEASFASVSVTGGLAAEASAMSSLGKLFKSSLASKKGGVDVGSAGPKSWRKSLDTSRHSPGPDMSTSGGKGLVVKSRSLRSTAGSGGRVTGSSGGAEDDEEGDDGQQRTSGGSLVSGMLSSLRIPSFGKSSMPAAASGFSKVSKTAVGAPTKTPSRFAKASAPGSKREY